MLGVNCSWDKSVRSVPSCKLFRRLVAGTSPLVYADLLDIQFSFHENAQELESVHRNLLTKDNTLQF